MVFNEDNTKHNLVANRVGTGAVMGTAAPAKAPLSSSAARV
jgi:hypothetical protein